MKIGIMTLPLHTNYGGILQNYALQITISNLGHEAWTINIERNQPSLMMKILSILLRIIRKAINRNVKIRIWTTKKEERIIGKNTNQFINEYINMTEPVFNEKQLSKLISSYNFDSLIVGSDQVWRPKYSSNIFNFFLDFISKENKIGKIGYSISFGVDYWEFNKKQTIKCSELSKRFDAISVREESAIDLCKFNLGINTIQLLDPTLLINKEEYFKLLDLENEPISKGNLFTYILDKNSDKDNIINEAAKIKGLVPFTVMPSKRFEEIKNYEIDQCTYPSVKKWIRAFYDADFIVTDSFHGTVFSIIFRKSFIAIANEDRGTARFKSLLDQFNLRDRLVYSNKLINKDLMYSEIDYGEIDSLINSKQRESVSFIKNNIENRL